MQREILCSCGTINEAGAYRCAKCKSMLAITGHSYGGDTTQKRVKPTKDREVQQEGSRTPVRQPSKTTMPLEPQGKPTRVLPNWPQFTRKKWAMGGLLLSVLLLIIILRLLLSGSGPIPPQSVNPKLPPLPSGIGSVMFPNGQYAGVNDGTAHPFDTQRNDPKGLREKARKDLQQAGGLGIVEAQPLWHQYLSGDNENDAEILIYLQNQDIMNENYVTLMVGIDFPKYSADSSDAIASTRSALQGIYVAQKEFNDQSKDSKLRLLLVNTADDQAYVPPVAKQMASIIKNDKTVIGILGWQTSERTERMLIALKKASISIPMVSQTASSDNLTDEHWNNLFRVAPLNQTQAQAALLQAKKLQASEAIVFMDTQEPYSQNLGQDIEKGFPGSIEENFGVENTTKEQFAQLLKAGLEKVHNAQDTVVFFTGTTNRDVGRFQDALAGYSGLRIIAGDAGYVAHPSSHGRWYFIAYAYHDEWGTLMGNTAPFSQEYSDAFDPEKRGGGYGYNLADAVAIISYDAAKVTLRGIGGATNPTSQDLQEGLTTISGSNAWQGVGGQIAFNANHEVIDKALITLWVNPKGYIQMLCIQGQFGNTVSKALARC